MTALWDKLILLVFCSVLYLSNEYSIYAVVPLIFVIFCAALESYLDKELFSFWIFITMVLLSLYFPGFTYFLPLFVYEMCCSRRQWFIPLALLPVFPFLEGKNPRYFLFILLVIILSLVLRSKSVIYTKKQHEYNLLRDKVTEKQMQLEKSNRELLEKQDYEVHLATLKERNRIAAELHDSIGHVLSSSLLQTGALIATCPDEYTRTHLAVLQKSLSGGMDEVRSSIHNLHDDSVDLYDEVRASVNEFLFCPVSVRYQIDNPPDKKIRYAFLSILKEGLANITRHSNATEVIIILQEHPALYQLVIRDNGSTASADAKSTWIESEGMGLPGIRQRVKGLGGNTVIRINSGFEIFVSVPKEMP